VRGEAWEGDEVAERYFPFISAPRFTLREFARTPSMWFWFTKDAADLEWAMLQDPPPSPPSASSLGSSPFRWDFLWDGASAEEAEPKQTGLDAAEVASILERDLCERSYILTGSLTPSIFADSCKFVDPNNAVNGLGRYRQALSFLFQPAESAVEQVRVRVLPGGASGAAAAIEASYVASGVLKLPWAPRIAPWSGSITYLLDAEGLIFEQTDVWNITRLDAIRQTFTPG